MADSLPDLDQLVEMVEDAGTRETAVRALIDALESDDENIRYSAVRAVHRVSGTVLDFDLAGEAFAPLVALLENDESSRVQLQALNTLIVLAESKGRDALIQPLLTALDDSQESLRAEAARRLAYIRDDRVIEPLRTLMEKDTSARVRGRAAFALAYLEPDLTTLRDAGGVAIDALHSTLNDTEQSVRLRAIWALGHLANLQSLRPLVKILNDGASPQERRKAAEALGQLGDSGAVEPLVTALQFDTEEGVKVSVVEALGRIGGVRVTEVLAQMLHHAVLPRVRASAARALPAAGDRDIVNDLIIALEDNSAEVRFRAALALGELADSRALEPLKSLVKAEDNRQIRTAVGQILERLEDT